MCNAVSKSFMRVFCYASQFDKKQMWKLETHLCVRHYVAVSLCNQVWFQLDSLDLLADFWYYFL